jgi:hypothetical protein
MSVKKLIILAIFCFICANINYYSYANEVGSKQETALSHKVETKNLSGVDLLIVKLYNNDRILYAIVVLLVMASLGSILAFGTDLVLKFFGMSVSKISHNE